MNHYNRTRTGGIAHLAAILAMGALLGGKTAAQRFPDAEEKMPTPEEIERQKRYTAERIEAAKTKRARKAQRKAQP